MYFGIIFSYYFELWNILVRKNTFIEASVPHFIHMNLLEDSRTQNLLEKVPQKNFLVINNRKGCHSVYQKLNPMRIIVGRGQPHLQAVKVPADVIQYLQLLTTG